MRAVEHKAVGLMKDKINIIAGEKGSGGASTEYSIHYGDEISSADIKSCHIIFQLGNPAESVNGITNEALLSVVLDRLEGFQSGDFKSRETALAITEIEEALLWLASRTLDRMDRGVEGRLEK